jgi:hypothetical protein
MTRLKEATVALEYTGHLPEVQTTILVESFNIGRITETDAQGFITGFEIAPNAAFPFGTESVTVEFTYSGTPPSQVVWKVYLNGAEDQSLRAVSTDDISISSTWYRTFGYNYTNVFILSAGEYVVEMYADSKLVQRDAFLIEE